MINFEQFAKYIQALSIPESEKNDLIVLVTPCFDFRDFLKKKHNLSDQEIENIIQLKIAAGRDKIYEGLELLDIADYTHALISRMSKVVTEFAKEEEYEHHESLELALKKIMLIGVQQHTQIREALN
jgi:bacterioferritin (cytochrome b1)